MLLADYLRVSRRSPKFLKSKEPTDTRDVSEDETEGSEMSGEADSEAERDSLRTK